MLVSLKALILPVGREMRPAAEIGEIPLLVERDLFAFGEVFDEFDLILFGISGHQPDRVRAGQREALDGQIALDDVLHLRLDLAEVFLRDRRLEVDIIIEAVFDGRPDGELAGGEDRLYRLREDVRSRMAVDLKPVFVFEGDELDLGVAGNDAGEVDQPAVDAGADGGARQPFADVLRDLPAADGRGIFLFVPALECDDHFSLTSVCFSENKKAPSNDTFKDAVPARFHLNCGQMPASLSCARSGAAQLPAARAVSRRVRNAGLAAIRPALWRTLSPALLVSPLRQNQVYEYNNMFAPFCQRFCGTRAGKFFSRGTLLCPHSSGAGSLLLPR